MATQYLSKISKGGSYIYIKDLEARDAILTPVNVDSLTTSTTFAKNVLFFLNGIIYRSTAATSNMPLTPIVNGSSFVYIEKNGAKCFVTTGTTINSGWEVYMDLREDYKFALKQDEITDLTTIRSNAALGATAYQKPSTGIPLTDLSAEVQSALSALVSSVVTVTADVSSSCSITGSDKSGYFESIIYSNTSGTDYIVTVPTTYSTPDGEAIELTCPTGGYCEVSYLNIGGTIYARGV